MIIVVCFIDGLNSLIKMHVKIILCIAVDFKWQS